jgi:hypothetical protein
VRLYNLNYASLFPHCTSSWFLFSVVIFVSVGKKLSFMALLGDLRQTESRTRKVLHETRNRKTMTVQFGLFSGNNVCVTCLRFFCRRPVFGIGFYIIQKRNLLEESPKTGNCFFFLAAPLMSVPNLPNYTLLT